MTRRLTDRELAQLWRRHFEVFDSLVYGYLRAEQQRRNGRDPGPAAVTLGDLLSKRHSLSAARYHPDSELAAVEHVREHVFRFSDPLSEFYAGKLEADWLRERAERDCAWE